MDKRKLTKYFKEFKEKTGIEYAITNTDDYGDCQSCVRSNFGFGDRFIYLKHWLKGMNKGKPYKELNKVYVGHNLSEEQGDEFIRFFTEKGYKVEPKKYDESKSFSLEEQNNG